MSVRRRNTRFGFQYGNADVSRVCEDGGAVVIRVASITTGKFVDVHVTPAGRKMQVSSGAYGSPADVPGEQP